MNNSGVLTADFVPQDGGRASVNGVMHFTTVIDLAGVKDSDSSGLALLIEWLSIARAEHKNLRYENIPVQLHQLARLSDVEELLTAG